MSTLAIGAISSDCTADDSALYIPLATQLEEFQDDQPVVSSTVADVPTCGPACCCSCCCPTQVWVNALFLTRESSGGDYFFPPKGEFRQAWDDDWQTAWGPSVGITFCPDQCNPGLRVGVEFFAVDGWSTARQVAGNISVQFPSLPYLPELTTPGVPDSGFGTANFFYRSNLYNTEFNIYRQSDRICWLTTLVGFRWLEISEAYSAVFETGNTAPNFAIDVNNHLYGLQLGGLANLRNFRAWRLDGWMKLGIYGNSADQDTMEDFTSAGGQRLTASARSADAAFVGDMGVSLSRPITDNLNFRFSYMGMWIEGLALAPEQLDNSDPSSGLATLDSTGGLFFHGGFIGGELLW